MLNPWMCYRSLTGPLQWPCKFTFNFGPDPGPRKSVKIGHFRSRKGVRNACGTADFQAAEGSKMTLLGPKCTTFCTTFSPVFGPPNVMLNQRCFGCKDCLLVTPLGWYRSLRSILPHFRVQKCHFSPFSVDIEACLAASQTRKTVYFGPGLPSNPTNFGPDFKPSPWMSVQVPKVNLVQKWSFSGQNRQKKWSKRSSESLGFETGLTVKRE